MVDARMMLCVPPSGLDVHPASAARAMKSPMDFDMAYLDSGTACRTCGPLACPLCIDIVLNLFGYKPAPNLDQTILTILREWVSGAAPSSGCRRLSPHAARESHMRATPTPVRF